MSASSYTECVTYAECRYAECRHAECRYAECRYAECRYDKCRGASGNPIPINLYWMWNAQLCNKLTRS